MDLPSLIGNQVVTHYVAAIQNALKDGGLTCRSSLVMQTVTTIQKTESETTERSRQCLSGALWGFNNEDRPRVRVDVDGDPKYPEVLHVRVFAYTTEMYGGMIPAHNSNNKDLTFTLSPTRMKALDECLQAIEHACAQPLTAEA